MANRVSKYIKNIDKELGQTLNAGEKAIKARGNANVVKLPSGKTVKFGLSEKEANKKVKAERGQLVGAILQGRRYDESGKLITKSSGKSKSAAKKKATPLQKAAVKAVKAGAKAAKNSMTMSKTARGSSQMSAEYNAGYIAGKKDIAAFKRNQAKKK